MTTVVSDVNAGHYLAALNLLLPGHDTIKGSSGNDLLNDYNGHDRIIGGAGNDTMSGSHGSDTFVFHTGFGQDQITHFVVAGTSHDDILLYSDTGITKSNLHSHEAYNSATHTVVITDTALDTITIGGVHNLAAFNADLQFHA
jgi:Ca2+-binding RTX toxin-like protein